MDEDKELTEEADPRRRTFGQCTDSTYFDSVICLRFASISSAFFSFVRSSIIRIHHFAEESTFNLVVDIDVHLGRVAFGTSVQPKVPTIWPSNWTTSFEGLVYSTVVYLVGNLSPMSE